MDSASDQAGVMMPRLSDRPGRAIALDALSFLALAAAVALGISAVLSAMVLLLAGRADATAGTAAASAPLRPHATGRAAALCAANDFANFLLPVVDQHTSRPPMPIERCHFSMKYSDSPEVGSTPTLLQVRRMNPGRAGRA